MTPKLKLTVAAPCSESWAAMKGDDRVRHCASCKLNVFNISALSATETVDLITKTTGKVCGRFYQRADGTVLTSDCPTGVAAIRRKIVLSMATMVALVVSVLSARAFLRTSSCQTAEGEMQGKVAQVEDAMRASRSVGWLINGIAPPPPTRVMGKISMVRSTPPSLE